MSRASHLYAVTSVDMSTTVRVPPAWTPLLNGFDAELRAAGRPRSTRELRNYQLRRFAADHPDLPVDALTREHLIAWLGSRDWAPETRRGYRACLIVFFRWLHKSGRLPTNPADDLPTVNLPRARPRPAPDAVLMAGMRDTDPRARLAIEIIDASGLRRAECASLHSRQVVTTFDGTALHIVGKGGHEREIPIPERIGHRLRAADGYVFPGLDRPHLSPQYLGKLISWALPDDWTAHTLRHRYATRVYRATGDILIVKELLGHANVATTQRYVLTDAERLRHAASTAWPLPNAA